MAREIVNMEETKSKRIEMLIKEKYLLIIREVGTYFSLDKKVLENGRKNEDGFSMVIWNGYMIIRNSFEQQIIDKLKTKYSLAWQNVL